MNDSEVIRIVSKSGVCLLIF